MKGSVSNDSIQTNWDSSKLTTIRIHELICEMHFCFINPTLKNKTRFLRLCECLYTEGLEKMNKQEKIDAELYRARIEKLKNKHGVNLYTPNIKGRHNIYYDLAWSELWKVAIDFQRFVIGSLDSHGMLMKNAARIEDNI